MSAADSPYSLSYLPLLIRLQCCEAASLPPYLGSTLHGVLGWKLTAQSDAYRYLFENRRMSPGGKQDIVNPYIVEPPRARAVYLPGDMLSFKLILLGTADRFADEVTTALSQSATYELGAERKRFQLVDILHGERLDPIWRQGSATLEKAVPETLVARGQEYAERCSIQLLTPLRIRRGGELVREIDFPAIIRSITRRMASLTERYGGYADSAVMQSVCERAASIRTSTSGLYVQEINRYSNRRNTTMDLSGLLGAMTFEGELAPFLPWLHAARTLHIGRNTTFGCGRLEAVWM